MRMLFPIANTRAIASRMLNFITQYKNEEGVAHLNEPPSHFAEHFELRVIFIGGEGLYGSHRAVCHWNLRANALHMHGRMLGSFSIVDGEGAGAYINNQATASAARRRFRINIGSLA